MKKYTCRGCEKKKTTVECHVCGDPVCKDCWCASLRGKIFCGECWDRNVDWNDRIEREEIEKEWLSEE